jgi:predicted aspartyl protease
MSYLKISLVALSAFALGFAASEYRRAPTSTDVIHQSASGNSASINPAPLNNISKSVDNRVEISQATNVPAASFSFEQVNQLINQGRYDEAIRMLQAELANNSRSAPSWLLLAQAYEKQNNHESALDAWFRYLDYEIDVVKREQAITSIKRYLLQLHSQPTLLADQPHWLITQLDHLLELSTNDGELHLLLASMYAQADDDYQAQYHALMAANDPGMQERAEQILAALSGATTPDNLTVPLVRLGNQYLVEVDIEGYPARLLLDTGASLSGVSNIYADKYPGIVKSTKPIRLNTAAGIADTYLFTVDYLTMGQLTFNQHILTLLPMGNMTEFDGLLGVDILGRFDFVIDQNALLLRLQARKN